MEKMIKATNTIVVIDITVKLSDVIAIIDEEYKSYTEDEEYTAWDVLDSVKRKLLKIQGEQ